MSPRFPILFAFFLLVFVPLRAIAQVQVPPPERLCDTRFEDCREPILNLIRNEQMGIDVGFWYMQDSLYATELIRRWQAGVPIRVLVDTRANPTYTLNPTMLQMLSDAGIPMREKFGEDVLHFKTMLFHGQNMVEFSKANYDSFAYTPAVPNSNYEDEAVFFTNDNSITNSFRRRFDDRWIDTSVFRNYANINGPLVRNYSSLLPIDPAMDFPPLEDFGARLSSRIDAERQAIDTIVFRVTDDRPTEAIIRAVARGVPVRLITEPQEYRNPKRLYDSKEIDRMYMGGAQIKIRQHQGLTHEASMILYGLGEVIFGSSNWTIASAINQDEHNYFYNPNLGKPWFFQWFANQFQAKWIDPTLFVPFQPLPPDPPSYSSPSNGVTVSGTSVTLTWDGGLWSHFYDIYFGTSSNPPLLQGNQQIGAPDPGVIETFTINNLQPGTTYFWRIVDRTWAQQVAGGPVWSFATSGSGGGGGGSTPYRGTPASIPGTFEAENFDEGGQSVAYFDTTAGNAGGVYRSTDVDLEATTDAGGGIDVMKTKASEWLKYSVNVTAAGTYPLDIRVANIGTGGSFHVEIDGVNVTGQVAVPDTGGWQSWQTITTPGIAVSAGNHVIRVSFDANGTSGGVGNYNWFRLGAGSPPPPPPPPSGNTPFRGTPAPLPGTVEAENFDEGGQSIAYFDTTAGNSGNVYRTTDVDIEATTDPADSGFDVMKTRAGEWLKYTVNVTTAATYQFWVRIANIGTGAVFHVEVDGVDRTGPVAVPNTGGWQSWANLYAGNMSLTPGQHVFRVSFDATGTGGGVGNYNYFWIGF